MISSRLGISCGSETAIKEGKPQTTLRPQTASCKLVKIEKESSANRAKLPGPPRYENSANNNPYLLPSSKSAMYRTYSPVENNNQVAVVPTSHHHSPSAFQASPTSTFGDDFGCSPPPQKRVCTTIDHISSTAVAPTANSAVPIINFAAEFPELTAIAQLPPAPAAVFKFGEQHQQQQGFGSVFDAALQQCEDSKVDLASYLQASVAGEPSAAAAIGSMQQQQHPRLGGMDLAPPVIRKAEDYSLVVYQQPEEVCNLARARGNTRDLHTTYQLHTKHMYKTFSLYTVLQSSL